MVNKLFTDIQQHLLLRTTGDLAVGNGNTVSFPGRNVTNKGDYYEVCFSESYTTERLNEGGMGNCRQPTTADQKKLKHLLRYIKGTQHYKFYIRPTVNTTEITPDIGVYVDSDWAGCATTRKSATGFVIKCMGATIHFGSCAQATIALSNAEAELYAINTGATEALHYTCEAS